MTVDWRGVPVDLKNLFQKMPTEEADLIRAYNMISYLPDGPVKVELKRRWDAHVAWIANAKVEHLEGQHSPLKMEKTGMKKRARPDNELRIVDELTELMKENMGIQFTGTRNPDREHDPGMSEINTPAKLVTTVDPNIKQELTDTGRSYVTDSEALVSARRQRIEAILAQLDSTRRKFIPILQKMIRRIAELEKTAAGADLVKIAQLKADAEGIVDQMTAPLDTIKTEDKAPKLSAHIGGKRSVTIPDPHEFTLAKDDLRTWVDGYSSTESFASRRRRIAKEYGIRED